MERKRNDQRINGVTVFADHRGGCWCELNMNGISASSIYKTCFLINKNTGNKCILTLSLKIERMKYNLWFREEIFLEILRVFFK